MTIQDLVRTEVGLYYVTASWVARHYGVSPMDVHRAIKAERLKAIKLRGGAVVMDIRQLPLEFPYPPGREVHGIYGRSRSDG